MTTLYSIGHGTRSWPEFVALLHEFGIETVADIRRYPGSRRCPQYNAAAMAWALKAERIRYAALPELGGRRRPRPDSVNGVWKNDGFRGYADFMATAEFREEAFLALMREAMAARTAMLCSETLWWKCHRRLVADYATVAGVEVWHILKPGDLRRHALSDAARIIDGQLSYRDPAAPIVRQAGL